MKSWSVIGWEERELWDGERNVWTLPWQAPVDGLCKCVCVDIFVGEQREEVGTTVPFRRVRKDRSEHTYIHTQSQCSNTFVGTSLSHLFLT